MNTKRLARWGSVAVGVVISLALMGTVRAEQSGTVPLHVSTNGLPAAGGTPVSGGVPFPIGAVATTDHLRLETLQGTVLPGNYLSLVSWPDGSVKSALVSFTPVPQGDVYPDVVLRYGPTVSHASTGAVQVTQDAQTLTVTTDVLKLQFSKTRFSVLEQAWSDLNLDGTFASSEQWLSGAADLQIVDKKTGHTFRSSLWTSSDGYAPRLVEVGPAKVTVLLEGRLKGVNGALTVDGDPTIAQAKIWISVYAGSTLIKVQTTLVDTKSRPTEQFSSRILELSRVALEVPSTLTNASYAAGGEGVVHQGQVGSEAHLLQDATVSFNGNFSYSFFYNGVGSGSQAPGWMDVSAGGRGVTMGLYHFWQTFPHKLAATGAGLLQLDFVPAESANSFWTVYPGVGKTYETFLDLHAGDYTAMVSRRAELALARPLLIADPSWYTSTQAFGQLSPRSSLSTHWDTKMENQYNCTALRQGCSIYAQVYGQRDFGDYEQGMGTNSSGGKYPEYGDGHYEDAHGFLVQFARTGDRKWFDQALPMARHHYDLDVMHTQNPPRYPGYPAGMIHWHGSSEHEGATIEFGHIVPGGLDEYYLLSGDPRALEVAREQGDWVEYWARSGGGRIAPERSGDGIGYTEYERPTAWTLYTLMKAYFASGDPNYWEAASILVKNTIDWWKMPQDHIVFDPSRQLDLTRPPQDQALYYQRSDWTQGTGYPLATLRSDNCAQTSAPLDNYAYQNHVPLGWMSGLLQTSLMRYYQELERRGGAFNATVTYRGAATPISIDTATMREMFVQMANMVADHIYVGAPKYPSKYPWLSAIDYNHFVYSACPERNPGVADGSVFLMAPLLFTSSFDPSQVSSRWQTNWSQLQAKWRDMIKTQYIKLVVNDLGPDTGYNGATNTWSMPFAVERLEALGLLNDLTAAPSTTTTSTTTTTSSGSSPPPPLSTSSSVPAYQVIVGDNNPFLTSALVDIRVVAPATATEMNVSATGLGQGTWQAVGEVHGLVLPPGPGTKTIYTQFRDAQHNLLASLTKSAVLLGAGLTGDVDLVLTEARDTHIFSNNADANFGNQPVVTAGKYDVGYDYWGLLSFPIPAAPPGVGVTVKGAQLNVYLLDNYRNASQVITPYEPTQGWDEDTVTWNRRPLLPLTSLGSGVLFTDRSEINRWKTFSLDPAVVQAWVQNPTGVHGVALVGDGTPGMTSVNLNSSESFYPADDYRPRLVLRLALSMTDVTPPVISNLQAANIGETSVTIQWTTDEDADGSAEYGLTTAYGQSGPPQTTRSTTHAIQLTGLTALTSYHARVTSADAAGNRTVSSDLVFATTGAIPGDINRDGRVDMSDVPGLIGELLGISPVTPATADVNADGRVDIGDLQALVNRL